MHQKILIYDGLILCTDIKSHMYCLVMEAQRLCKLLDTGWGSKMRNLLFGQADGFVRATLCTTSWVSVFTPLIIKVHIVALYQLGGAQDDFACSLWTTREMVHNTM